MSVPKSKILSCTRGFLAQADVGINSPQSSQANNQNVNIVLNTNDKATDDLPKNDTNPYPSVTPIYPPQPQPSPLIQNAEGSIQTREVSDLIDDKDSLIEALNLIIEIKENNPLIVNKYVIAEKQKLMDLIYLLTSCDEVKLVTIDPETTCGCKLKSVEVVTKIIVKKGDDVFNLKYNYPDVIEELDRRNISYKLVC